MSKVTETPHHLGASQNIHDTRHEIAIEDRQFQRMKVVGNLMCGLAHDFNNILTIILSFTEMAQHSERFHSQHHLEGVANAATRGQHLVQQVLLFGRQQEQKPMSINLAEVIQKTLSLLRVSLPATIKIDVDRVAHSKCCIMADPIQISQLLMNLCLNAAQSMSSTGGVLELSLVGVTMDREEINGVPDLTSGSFVRMRVRDTGSGIPPEVIGQMFDPFFTTNQSGDGMGMGLTVVRDIVARHSGMIAVDSTVGEGTIFDIYLPQISDWVEKDAFSNWPNKEKKDCLIVDEELSICQNFQERPQHLDCSAFAQMRN